MENMLSEKAWEQPWFGWGGSGRSQVYDINDGHRKSIVDGLWIEILGEHGFVGLFALLTMVLGSAFMLWRRVPTAFWSDPACASPGRAVGRRNALYDRRPVQRDVQSHSYRWQQVRWRA